MGVCQRANFVSVQCVCVCCSVVWGGRCCRCDQNSISPFSQSHFLPSHTQVGRAHRSGSVCTLTRHTPRSIHIQIHTRILTVSDLLPLARPTNPLPVRSEEQDHLGKEEKEVRVLLYVCLNAGAVL